ncbi:endolytic transglycosylase MltG [Blautia hydrogenotrophica]|uniref:endolytic transglycosylase MltG n=1 Tax=Blautia hydrogenotrophica TaxID=53443 RepID=UPI002E787994|nr:endolytic transglycosylase MltG [Blautia hydrogenotrophica]MEE0463256.1 endolytic transglycosylase MltG [Blautia hydrogenotrophica]
MRVLKNNEGKATSEMAGSILRILLYVCVVFLIIWAGKTAYHFGYSIFNQRAMSPEDGQEVTVVIKEGASAYQVGKTLEKKGLIEDAKVFVFQEKLSNYRGQIKAGTYILSTAYTPDRILAVLSGQSEEEDEGGTVSQ